MHVVMSWNNIIATFFIQARIASVLVMSWNNIMATFLSKQESLVF